MRSGQSGGLSSALLARYLAFQALTTSGFFSDLIVPPNRSLVNLKPPVARILNREPDLIKPFELAQLGNILPDTAEMAKSLIPSCVSPFFDSHDPVRYNSAAVLTEGPP